MSRNTKIWLIIAVFLLLIGCIILGGILAILQWDLSSFSTDKYETNEFRITDQFESISIITDTADIEFVPSGDKECSVICYEQKSRNHSVAVKEGVLVIEVEDSRNWYENIGIHFQSPKITVQLPESQYRTLSVQSDTGDVDVPQEFSFDSINISEDTGDVTIFASASNTIKIKTSTGKIHVENASTSLLDLFVSTGNVTVSNVICAGDVTIHVSTGKTTIRDTKCKNLISDGSTGDISLKNVIAEEKFSIERSTGDVKLDGVDAAELFITTDTGNVTGTLLSDKIFSAHSDAGNVKVPNTGSGGRCEISTDTGNIVIQISTNQ